MALEASCATHPNTSPSSFAFILEHISTHTHTHIPQSRENIGAHRPNGVKLAVNQLQKPTLQNSMERKEFATKADKHVLHEMQLEEEFMKQKCQKPDRYLRLLRIKMMD